MAVTKRLLRFGVVGVLGYLVDTAVLLLLVQWIGVNPLPGRVVSFLVAATVTFAFHHYFTFRLAGGLSAQRWAYYLATTSVGALINVGLYHLWVVKFGAAPLHLVLGTAVGSGAAMCVNYFASSVLVFRPPNHVKRAR